jgi:hypothetical protein
MANIRMIQILQNLNYDEHGYTELELVEFGESSVKEFLDKINFPHVFHNVTRWQDINYVFKFRYLNSYDNLVDTKVQLFGDSKRLKNVTLEELPKVFEDVINERVAYFEGKDPEVYSVRLWVNDNINDETVKSEGNTQ